MTCGSPMFLMYILCSHTKCDMIQTTSNQDEVYSNYFNVHVFQCTSDFQGVLPQNFNLMKTEYWRVMSMIVKILI